MRKLLNPLAMLLCGLAIGAAVRLLDIYTENLGVIFSQMAVWILLGTLIAIYSPTPGRAMANILPFCLGMLATYYAVAIITHGVYGKSYIVGCTVFALLSPLMAYLAWRSKEKRHLCRSFAAGHRGGVRALQPAPVRGLSCL